MATIASLQVLLSAQTAKFDSAMKGSIKRLGMLQAAAVRTKAAMSGLGAALGVGGIGFAIKGSVAAFAEEENAIARLDAVLTSTQHAAGLTTDQMTRMAAEFQRTTRFADDMVISAQSVLATFKEIKSPVFKEAMEAAMNMSTIMGQDLQSSIVQVGKALNDPIVGLTALRRVGVSFNDQQKEMIATLQKSGDVLGAQKIILAELASEFGGAAQKSAETMAGKIDQMKNAWGDMAETIGGLLAPALTKAADEAKRLFDEMNFGAGKKIDEVAADIKGRGVAPGSRDLGAMNAAMFASMEQQQKMEAELIKKRKEVEKLLTGKVAMGERRMPRAIREMQAGVRQAEIFALETNIAALGTEQAILENQFKRARRTTERLEQLPTQGPAMQAAVGDLAKMGLRDFGAVIGPMLDTFTQSLESDTSERFGAVVDAIAQGAVQAAGGGNEHQRNIDNNTEEATRILTEVRDEMRRTKVLRVVNF
jgi:phage-related minor tail protein